MGNRNNKGAAYPRIQSGPASNGSIPSTPKRQVVPTRQQHKHKGRAKAATRIPFEAVCRITYVCGGMGNGFPSIRKLMVGSEFTLEQSALTVPMACDEGT